MLISPFYHSFIHLNMNTIALNAESRLILTRQMDTKIYLKSNIVYSSFLSPVSFFLSCFGLFCHTKLYIDQSAPGSNQDTDRSSFKLSFCHFLLYLSLSQSLSPVFFPFSISPRRIHCLISMAGFQGLRFSSVCTLFPEYNNEDRKRGLSCPYDGWAVPLYLDIYL